MRRQTTGMLGTMLAGWMLLAGTAPAAFQAPTGVIRERTIDRAAGQAIEQWIREALNAPHLEGVANIGILPLANDPRNFTELLAARLSAEKRFHVVILRGADWKEIEDEWARTDPNSGFGDIMDKAAIKWKAVRGTYVIPESAKGADALLVGRVRHVDEDWLRAWVSIPLSLARVDTRERIGGANAEGESYPPLRDLVIYYKVEIALVLLALFALVVSLLLLRGLVRRCTRPR